MKITEEATLNGLLPIVNVSLQQHLIRLEEFRKGLLARSNFIILQTVRLRETPEINETVRYGWVRSKHFLVKGARGIVRELDFWEGMFRYGIEFYDETRLVDGREEHVKEKHLHWFNEKELEKIH